MALRLVLALGAVALLALAFPDSAHAWTPGTHVYLGESLLANLHLLPVATAELLRAFPFDFLYGNIAADSSIAKKYAPVGRHSHYWQVGQEIHDLAESDALRAFGLGYLCHLAADVVAHNFFVPRRWCSPRARRRSGMPTGKAASRRTWARRIPSGRAT